MRFLLPGLPHVQRPFEKLQRDPQALRNLLEVVLVDVVIVLAGFDHLQLRQFLPLVHQELLPEQQAEVIRKAILELLI